MNTTTTFTSELHRSLELGCEVEKQIAELDQKALAAEKVAAGILADGKITKKEEEAFMRARTTLELVPAQRGRLIRDLKERTAQLPDLLRDACAEFNRTVKGYRDARLKAICDKLSDEWPDLNRRQLVKKVEQLSPPSLARFRKLYAQPANGIRDPLALVRHAELELQRMQRTAEELGFGL